MLSERKKFVRLITTVGGLFSSGLLQIAQKKVGGYGAAVPGFENVHAWARVDRSPASQPLSAAVHQRSE